MVRFARPSVKEYKKKYGTKSVVACEIGVGSGANAESILGALNIKSLTLIDSWHTDYNADIDNWLLSTAHRFENDNRVGVVKINSSYA